MNTPIPVGRARKLYLYSDLVRTLAWCTNPAEFRSLTGSTARPIRVAHPDIPAPNHYHKPYGHLANDPIERIPTLRDLIRAL